ncbi:hypothetical protein BCE75_1085 [Isoptericola sp. CG 20/1183]|uniref:Uncharacterized protein n=1 Tax=Isoptericola halotolerans TaxID=300560 RepID=A0ABX5EEF6_9MICO|nr:MULTISPECIES: hypothetical protein [Isoptericola]PRZ05027.1 hypothetical protein BCL65_1085 [Isoptericola halotolerans]PRZ05766.1 hypothetical protein BCE75_1085 [Isoptericola sp. CG 20/1183]
MDIARSVLVLDDTIDLAELRENARWLGRQRVDDVKVHLHVLTADEAAVAAHRIRRTTNDCGCRWGESLLALTALALWLVPVATDVTRPGVLGSILLLLTAAVGGKLAGLAASRARLRSELRRLGALTGRGELDGRDLP